MQGALLDFYSDEGPRCAFEGRGTDGKAMAEVLGDSVTSVAAFCSKESDDRHLHM